MGVGARDFVVESFDGDPRRFLVAVMVLLLVTTVAAAAIEAYHGSHGETPLASMVPAEGQGHGALCRLGASVIFLGRDFRQKYGSTATYKDFDRQCRADGGRPGWVE